MSSRDILEPPPGFQPLDPEVQVGMRARRMPHWTQPGATYFVTFRLADSLSRRILDELREFKRCWESQVAVKSLEEHRRFSLQLRNRIEEHLDRGLGSCLLSDMMLAGEVEKVMRTMDGKQYLLGSYVVMPNHVHALVKPFDLETNLSHVMRSWLGVSSRRIHQRTGGHGELWQEEPYDTIVRTCRHLRNVVRYIGKNPARAGLNPNRCFRWVRPEWADAGYGFDSD